MTLLERLLAKGYRTFSDISKEKSEKDNKMTNDELTAKGFQNEKRGHSNISI